MTILDWIISLFKTKNQIDFYEKKKNVCDIEDKKKTKMALKEREASLKCAQEIANLGSLEWHYNSNKLFFSDEMYRIFGIDEGNFQGNLDMLIENSIHPEYKKMIQEMFQKAIEFGEIEKKEFIILKSNGEQRWVRANGALINDEDGSKLKIIGTLQDITEWKEADGALQENYKFLQTLMDTIPTPIFYKDIKGVYKYSNIAHIEYMGLRKEDIIGHTVFDILPKHIAHDHDKADMEVLHNKGKKTYETKLQTNDGLLHDIIFTKAVITNKEDNNMGIVGVIVDITERKKDEKRINRLLKLKESFLEVNHAIIGIDSIHDLFDLILDKVVQSMDYTDFVCVLVLDEEENLVVSATRGYDPENAKSYKLKLRDTFIWNITEGNIEKTIIINDIQEILNGQFPDILQNSSGFEVQSSISAPIIIKGKLYGFVNVDSSHNHVYDETDLDIMEYMRNQIEIAISKHQLYEEIIYLSRYDKLTNVYNRRYFEEMFDTYMHNAIAYDESFSLVVFDLNGLKHVNDTLGHLAGDEFIKTFARGLRSRIQSSDIFARFGGDEFIAVFNETDMKILTNRFEELAKELNNNPIKFEGNNIICSFSYGIANFPKDSNCYKELVKIADERMYRYKEGIKNKYKNYPHFIIS